MKNKTLIQLIDEICMEGHKYLESHDESHIFIMNDCASTLAERLGCSRVAAICFAFIMTEAAWGRMPTRNDIMKFLPVNTSTVERLECIWELRDKKFVLMYKPARNPIRHFYVDQEIAEKVVANRVPTTSQQSLFPIEEYRKVRLNASSGKNDYEILLEGKKIGFILMSASHETYEVYWQGLLVYEAEDLSSIVEWLNEAYENGTLKSTQI